MCRVNCHTLPMPRWPLLCYPKLLYSCSPRLLKVNYHHTVSAAQNVHPLPVDDGIITPKSISLKMDHAFDCSADRIQGCDIRTICIHHVHGTIVARIGCPTYSTLVWNGGVVCLRNSQVGSDVDNRGTKGGIRYKSRGFGAKEVYAIVQDEC